MYLKLFFFLEIDKDVDSFCKMYSLIYRRELLGRATYLLLRALVGEQRRSLAELRRSIARCPPPDPLPAQWARVRGPHNIAYRTAVTPAAFFSAAERAQPTCERVWTIRCRKRVRDDLRRATPRARAGRLSATQRRGGHGHLASFRSTHSTVTLFCLCILI